MIRLISYLATLFFFIPGSSVSADFDDFIRRHEIAMECYSNRDYRCAVDQYEGTSIEYKDYVILFNSYALLWGETREEKWRILGYDLIDEYRIEKSKLRRYDLLAPLPMLLAFGDCERAYEIIAYYNAEDASSRRAGFSARKRAFLDKILSLLKSNNSPCNQATLEKIIDQMNRLNRLERNDPE
ncbi:hypothetical protein [Thiorhodococcus minor]|uniref:Uncharacterized protein n=1 Tax=Thiorhodococcus minor TaxID=57489 RepID=A0A6M0K764_9GAMM|nr:hypothetical protein [Thiorhodococcus minor]NEV65339.1 hypothetical protein [Thiorhodococcus minor]